MKKGKWQPTVSVFGTLLVLNMPRSACCLSSHPLHLFWNVLLRVFSGVKYGLPDITLNKPVLLILLEPNLEQTEILNCSYIWTYGMKSMSDENKMKKSSTTIRHFVSDLFANKTLKQTEFLILIKRQEHESKSSMLFFEYIIRVAWHAKLLAIKT